MNKAPGGAILGFTLNLILVLVVVAVALAAPLSQGEPTPLPTPTSAPTPTRTFTPIPTNTPTSPPPPTKTPKPEKTPTETEAPEQPTETTAPTSTPGLQPITLIPSGTATPVAQATYPPVVQTPPPPPPPPPPPTNTPTLPPTPTMTPTPSPTVTPTPTPIDTTPPAPPLHLTAASGRSEITLTWTASAEPDLDGYRLYRSTTSGSGYARLASVSKRLTRYVDTAVMENVRYYYVVTAFDINNNESDYSNEAMGMVSPAMPPSGGEILPGFLSSPLFWGLTLLAFLLLSRLVKVKEADTSQASD